MESNAQKMREALEKIAHYAEDICGMDDQYCADWHICAYIARKALSKPPKPLRNCDKYSHDEALEIWAAEKENGENGCFDEWLYAPAEQKGNQS